MAGPPSVTEWCPSKVNLFLEVLGKRPDGYHDIETVMVPAPFRDRLDAGLRPRGGVTLELRFPPGGECRGVPADDRNLAVRGARLLLAEAGAAEGVHLALLKAAPPGAGLGGGSSDAAGALRAVNRLLGEPLPPERLAALALSLGSDVPYFLRGGTAVARGRGEILEEVPGCPAPRLLVLWPGAECSTAEVFRRCRVPPAGERRDPAPLLRALAAGDAAGASRACFNRLAVPALEACPRIGEALDALRSLGAGEPHMTGSGSACFLLLPPGVPGRNLTGLLQGRLPGGRIAVSED